MLSASKIALTPELAVHSEIARPIRKLTPVLSRLGRRVGSFVREARRSLHWGRRSRSCRETGYGSGVGKEAVYRNQSCDTRENSEQRIERDASGDQEDAVLRDTMIDPQKNVLPPPDRDLRRRLCRSPTAGFKRLAIACRGARIPRAPPGKSECNQQDAQSDSP
jgi:hypothetical protein